MNDLWAEIGATMRALRTSAGVSLRTVESLSGTRRGTLSQYETAKAHPNRRIVEWYDTAFDGDGLLLSLHAEARGAYGGTTQRRDLAFDPADALTVDDGFPAFGAMVETGARHHASWTLHNTGSVPWQDRLLERVGPRAASRLITSEARTAVPDCGPGEQRLVGLDFVVPSEPGCYVAYWQMVDAAGRTVLPLDVALSVVVIARERTALTG